ncbi:hypothetical protein SAMN02745702_01024 [Desulfobaculum bizertense DSM 18034]|uniref:Uncharacterized protein n=1 Tax=Desulfobaculum bizertense DSM 18034 TaxID=1121442 RepID=A0A1T4VVW7_9BACT|nr:hypothetical protein SAMN02745702_01024 [Desulfobaculum bizertense DSM 18034]
MCKNFLHYVKKLLTQYTSLYECLMQPLCWHSFPSVLQRIFSSGVWSCTCPRRPACGMCIWSALVSPRAQHPLNRFLFFSNGTSGDLSPDLYMTKRTLWFCNTKAPCRPFSGSPVPSQNPEYETTWFSASLHSQRSPMQRQAKRTRLFKTGHNSLSEEQ